MIINNPDALKAWLSIILEPLCDADPSALARYVFALLKKDKPIKELKKSMTEQLDVFLGADTKPFLERLFTAISSEEYLKSPINDVSSIKIEETNGEPQKECTPPLEDSKAKELIIKEEASLTPSLEKIPPSTVAITPVSAKRSVSPTKPTSDKENQPRESRRRVSVRSRSRSRSRSNDRNRRSRSRDHRATEREKFNRQFRNKSPPIERRRTERRNDRSPRGFGKNRTKSRSMSRSRSGSPEKRKFSRSSSPPLIDGSNILKKRQRCRDFDEKGYCVRGETCPWDHGINPVVLEGINNQSLINMPSHLREYNPDAPELWNRTNTFSGPRPNFPPKPNNNGMPGTYIRPPNHGFRPAGPPFPFPMNPAVTPLQRELISVPVVDGNTGGDISASQTKRRYEPEDTVAVAEGPTKRKILINNRLGPRIGLQQNCSLELRKIPRGMNTIAHLNNHFSKFGKIVNIQISYDGDPEAAIITFSTHAEANVAYRSTEAVLNNRFIKVFWHSPGNAGDITNTGSAKDEIITNGRKMSQYHVNNMIPAVPTAAAEGPKNNNVTQSNISNSSAPVGTTTTTTTTTTNTGTTTIVAVAHVKPSNLLRVKNNRTQTAAIARKKQDQAKAVVQLAHGLHKRKQELLQEYLKQMKSAVELLERVEHTDSQRSSMLGTIKELQATIDGLRKEISSEQIQIAAQIQNPALKKSKEQQKKELLDIELELIAQQQEGNDTTAIQKRIEELQRSLGISQKPHFSNRNMRSRNVAPGSTSVDHRTKSILITGFAHEHCDLILGHFKHFGEITKTEMDRNIPQLIVSYATRSNAEQAVIRGRIFKDKRLQISWAPVQNSAQQANNNNNNTGTSHSISEKINSDPLPDIRMEDEEEEEDGESEDRTWRR